MVANGDVLSATIVSVANLIVLFTNTAGANEKIDDRLLLPPWKGDAARVLARVGTKKEDNLSIVFFVPPQGVAYTRTEGRRTNNPRTWFAIGFDFLSKSCLTLQTYILSLTILFLQIS